MRSAARTPVFLTAGILAAALALTACDAPPPVELGPQGRGGIASGVAGSGGAASATGDAADAADDPTTDTVSATPTAAGSLLDAGRGANFASLFRDDDARYFQQAEISARGTFVGGTVTWRNPSTGTVGTITPLNERTIGGQECRDFFLTVTIDSRQHSESATACKSGDEWGPRAS